MTVSRGFQAGYVGGFLRATLCRMAWTVRQQARGGEPLTFHNAPTYERDGRTYVEHDAALELARRIAEDDAELLQRLAEQ